MHAMQLETLTFVSKKELIAISSKNIEKENQK